MRRWLLFALGILVSLAFLFVGFHDLQVDQLWDVLKQINIIWLVIAAAVYFVAAYIITWRWRFLLRPVQDIPTSRLFPMVIIGYMGNNIYPFRIGEVIRAYILNQQEDTPIPATLTTIFVERVFDGITMLLFVFAALRFVTFDAPGIQQGIAILTILFIIALVVFFVFAMNRAWAQRLYTAIITRVVPALLQNRIIALADELMDGLAALRDWRDMLRVALGTLVSWTVEATTYWLVLQAFPFTANFFVVLLMVGLGNLATILPTTPGYVGTFHGVVVLVLLAFGISQPEAAAYAIVMHAVIWAPVTIAGFALLIQRGLGWGDFAKAKEAVSAATKQP